MKQILYENLPYLAILLVCLLQARKIVAGTGSTIMIAYGRLSEEEKELYDISKVKMSQILYLLSLFSLTIFAFVFSVFFPNIISSRTFIVCYLVEIIVLLIFSRTKWILNWFCEKR